MKQIEWQVALEVNADLGEGLHWDGEQQRLWMVDIHGRRIMRWNPSSPRWDEWAMPQRVGWVIPERGRLSVVVGLQEGFARAWLGDSVTVEWLARPFGGNASLRLNDAKADSSGAIWAGSMNNDDESRSDGCLFRLAPSGAVTMHDEGYLVANGPAISPDERLMLHTDSARREIYAFDLDVGAARVTNKRLWARFSDSEGFPDGMCFDAEGHVWIAHWAAGCVSRLSPSGHLERRIALPAPFITNVCFAGANLERLFVSSARADMSPDELTRFPLAGALFEVRADVVGPAPTN